MRRQRVEQKTPFLIVRADPRLSHRPCGRMCPVVLLLHRVENTLIAGMGKHNNVAHRKRTANIVSRLERFTLV